MDASRLAGIPLFAQLSPDDLAALATAAVEVEAETGRALATERDFGHALFVIESGTAEVRSDDTLLRTLGPGDVFGEIAVLSSGRRTASVVATSPMRLIGLFKREVWALEEQSPETIARLRELIAERNGPTT